MLNLLKRIRWCYYILRGKRVVLFFPKLLASDATTACKYGNIAAEEWDAIADIASEAGCMRHAFDAQRPFPLN